MLIIPENYHSPLDYRRTEKAIKFIKDNFEKNLSEALKLERVSAPLYVAAGQGINDDLSGVERPVSFDAKKMPELELQIVQSLAKWKRMSLKQYDYRVGEGIYTDMNAVRRDEDLDNIHSLYVDQWDWERVITPAERNIEYLKDIVRTIVGAICGTAEQVRREFKEIKFTPEREVFFIDSQELEDMFPGLTPKQREEKIAKTYKTVFISRIGAKLKSGAAHDSRAPDYDDWELNGDIIFWNDVLGIAFELSSMGIRVSPESLFKQLNVAGCLERAALKYHAALLKGELPQTIGGGIGQSRLCMLLLEKAHIGEVHASAWDKETQELCGKNGIKLL